MQLNGSMKTGTKENSPTLKKRTLKTRPFAKRTLKTRPFAKHTWKNSSENLEALSFDNYVKTALSWAPPYLQVTVIRKKWAKFII